MTDEKWAAIAGFEGLYEVSDRGSIRSLDRVSLIPRKVKGRPLKPSLNGAGYLSVCLYKDGIGQPCRVHSLVIAAFVAPVECGHNNGDRLDNRADNLRWVTKSENQLDRARHGTDCRGERHPAAKLTRAEVIGIRYLLKLGTKQRLIAEKFGVSTGHVAAIGRRKTWAWLPDE